MIRFFSVALLACCVLLSCETPVQKTNDPITVTPPKITIAPVVRDSMQQRLYNECLGATPESQSNPAQADDFCNCVVDSVTKRFGEENFRRMEHDLPYEKMADTIADIAKHCLQKSGMSAGN